MPLIYKVNQSPKMTYGTRIARTRYTPPSASLLGNSARKEDILGELDIMLEGCQNQCELAAHSFLRDSGGVTKVEAVKTKLGEMQNTVLMELEPSKKPAEIEEEDSLKDPDFRMPTLRKLQSAGVDVNSDKGKERNTELIKGTV